MSFNVAPWKSEFISAPGKDFVCGHLVSKVVGELGWASWRDLYL